MESVAFNAKETFLIIFLLSCYILYPVWTFISHLDFSSNDEMQNFQGKECQ